MLKSLKFITLTSLFLVGCSAPYEAPAVPSKQTGYLIVSRPMFTLHGNDAHNKAMKWLDAYEKQGWKLIGYNGHNGEYIFHKETTK